MVVLLIAHDLQVVRRFADRVVVLKDGNVCEQGVLPHVIDAPDHEFTRSIVQTGQPITEILEIRARQASQTVLSHGL